MTTMSAESKMAMSSDFLEAYARLPKPQQRGARALISKFNAEATLTGLNYEPIKNARHANMRSLRIDQGYRAIVLKPESGNVYVLLWADKHDVAYAWAERHECRINPETGALQVYEPEVAEVQLGPADVAEQSVPGLFNSLKDRELRRLGVPPVMLPEIREVDSEDALDRMQTRLPVEAYEALFLFLAGESYENLVLEREPLDEPVDTEDYVAALGRTESRARFIVIEDETELEEMLNAPLERWRVFLHPSQCRLVERHWNGPVRVLGGAGTGKTVVAMHRARWLARNAPERGRILFTTFTRNLAADIEHNLHSICTPEEMSRIEVVNLDRWASRFLRGQHYDFRIVYGRDRDAWSLALDLKATDLDFPDAFYDDEWEQVVQANGVTTEEQYRRVSRVGRGTRLNRAARGKVWKVFEEYRAQLAERALKEVDDGYRDAAALLEEKEQSFDYVSVIVDEAQDMGAQSYRLIRNIVSEGADDLFIVGDGHQRIYGRNKVVLSRCGVNIRGRSRKLRLNYRTTEETRRWATGLLEGREIDDLDGGSDDNKAFKSLTHGPVPTLEHFAAAEEQGEFIVAHLSELAALGEPQRNVCIVARTARERDGIKNQLEASGVAVVVLESGAADTAENEGVRFATMHRVKGIEFDHVIIASVNDGVMPNPAALAGKGDDIERASAETEERALLYVAATRAKKELLVLSYGAPSRFFV